MYIGTSNPPAFLETCWIYLFSWGWQQRQIPVVTRARSVESTAGTENFGFSSGHRSRSSVTQGPVDPRPPDHAVSPPCPRWGEWLHFTSVNRCSQISPSRKWSRVIRFLQHVHQDGSGGASFWTSIVQCHFQKQRHRNSFICHFILIGGIIYIKQCSVESAWNRSLHVEGSPSPHFCSMKLIHSPY